MPETTTQETGADARAVNEQALAAAREEAVQAERQRVSEIQSLSATAIKYGIDGDRHQRVHRQGRARRSGPEGTVCPSRE